MGVVKGQGLTGLIRERYGVRIAVVALVALWSRTWGRPAPSSRASPRASGWRA